MTTLAELKQQVAQSGETGGEFQPLPAGTYRAIVDSGEVRTPNNGGNPYIALTFRVVGEHGTNRLLWHNLNLNHSTSEKARNISKAEFLKIVEACDFSEDVDFDLGDGQSLINLLKDKIMYIKTKPETRTWQGETRTSNKVTDWISVNDPKGNELSQQTAQALSMRATTTSNDVTIPF